MRIPQLRENFLHVVLVHAEQGHVGLGAHLAYESSIRDVCMSRLPLVTINAVSVELVVCHYMIHERAKILRLSLLHDVAIGHAIVEGLGRGLHDKWIAHCSILRRSSSHTHVTHRLRPRLTHKGDLLIIFLRLSRLVKVDLNLLKLVLLHLCSVV